MEKYGHHFLRDRWHERSSDETGEVSDIETRRQKDLELYLDIQQRAKDIGGSLYKIFQDVERRAVRYRTTINTNTTARMDARKSGLVSEFEESDTRQRLAHDALISEVNLLSRQFKEEGLDNEWRREIGLERHDVGRWGATVANLIYRRFEEEHYDH